MSTALRTVTGLAPDPALPRRDDLLDEEQVAALLESLAARSGLGAPVTGCVRVRARYRPGESLRATYRLVGEDGSRLVSARMFTAAKAPAKFLLARDEADRQGAPGDAVFLDESLGTVFWVFPQDRKLRGLDRLVDPPAALRDVFGRPWVRSELLAYTPEKAATVRCTDASGATVGFAKVHAGDEGLRSVETLRTVRDLLLPRPGAPVLPEPVGYLPELRMALFSTVPGEPLHHTPRARVPAAMAALGEALGVLHASPTAGLPAFNRFAPDRLATAGELLRQARPDLAELVLDVVVALLAVPHRPAADALLHGDLHPKNVLVHGGDIGLVDLDQAAVGPAAAELGATLARLWCPRPHDTIDPATATAAADALLTSYPRPPSTAELRWYAAAALLVERAVRAVSRVDLATLGDLERVLTTALHWAGDAAEDRA